MFVYFNGSNFKEQTHIIIVLFGDCIGDNIILFYFNRAVYALFDWIKAGVTSNNFLKGFVKLSVAVDKTKSSEACHCIGQLMYNGKHVEKDFVFCGECLNANQIKKYVNLS